MSAEMDRPCMLINVPIEAGAGRAGCALGPDALRRAGLAAALRGDARLVEGSTIAPRSVSPARHPNHAIHGLAEVAGWTMALDEAAFAASVDHRPVFLGGDHSLSAGTVSGMARRAAAEGRPLFVLWLDAHADSHTLDTTTSGNLHGVPMAYVTGAPGFDGYLPTLERPMAFGHVCVLGVRSIDPAEHAALRRAGAVVHGVDALTPGAFSPVHDFLAHAAAVDALLHVSLDADVLDPAVAPGVGTAVPGGAALEDVRRVLTLVRASGLVRSLDLVELNPALDPSGRTAEALVSLAAALFGAGP